MGDSACSALTDQNGKNRILLNVFDMSTVGHLSPGSGKTQGYIRHEAQRGVLDSPVEHDERHRQADDYLRVIVRPSLPGGHVARWLIVCSHVRRDDLCLEPLAGGAEAQSRWYSAAGGGEGDSCSITLFATFTPILGQTDEKTYASKVGGSSSSADGRGSISRGSRSTGESRRRTWSGGPVREYPGRVHDHEQGHAAAGGGREGVNRRAGPVAIGSAVTVADEMKWWIAEVDLDGFNIGHV